MEIILNTASKPFNFSFFLKGGLKTVQIIPGASRVKAEYLPELRKIRMFATLEDDNVLAVGVKESKATIDAPMIGKDAAPAKVEVKVEVEEALEMTKPLKAVKASKKTAKKLGTLDLEEL